MSLLRGQSAPVTRAGCLILILGMTALAGCGGAAGDLLAFEVSGGFQGAKTTITVTGDGRGTCDRGLMRPVDGPTLIEARELQRELAPLASAAREFGAPGADQRQYVVRMREGSVRWPEGGEDLPPVLGRAVLLERALEQQLCE